MTKLGQYYRLIFSSLVLSALLAQSASVWSNGYQAEKKTERKPVNSFWSLFGSKENSDSPERSEGSEPILAPIVIRVTGYGAYENKKDAKLEPKRLLAIRASKLDAYRALAERIYGVGITGSSSVHDFVMKQDEFGTVVDSYIRGARVVSISENKGAGFETVLELLLPGNFKDCLSKVNSFRHGANCLLPLPNTNPYRSGVRSKLNKTTPKYAMDSVYFLDQ